MAAIFSRCTGSSSSGSTPLSTAGKISSGLGTATETLQSMGSALGNGGAAFSVGGASHQFSAATSCTVHGDPGEDTDVSGVVDDDERFYADDYRYALQKVYCTLVSETDGPESVSGAISLIKTIACAVDKQLGSLTFDGTANSVNEIVIDTQCASAALLQNLNGDVPATSVTLAIPSTITATKDVASDISEFSNNTFYTHAIKIASNDVTSLKFIILAKFDDTIEGDPIENGDFEFATYGTGTQMQGTTVDYTAGKIDRSSSTAGTLWYESRHNRIKSTPSDPVCQPGDPTASSCGFARHTRLRTEITFSGGDISDVSNMTAIISDGNDQTGSGSGSDRSFILTATGSLATSGITGSSWLNATNVSPESLDSTSVLNGVSGTVFSTAVSSCVLTTGGVTSGSACSSAPAAHVPTGTTATYFLPANSTAWLDYLSSHGGLGFTGATSLSDIQSGL